LPYSAADAKGLLKSAIRDPNPVIFLENEILYGRPSTCRRATISGADRQGQGRAPGQGRHHRLLRHRHDLCAEGAAEALAKEGIDAEVIDLRTIRPMDIETVIASVQKTNRCVAVEEGFPQSGVTAEIGMRIMERRSTISTRRSPVSPARTCRCPTRRTSRSCRRGCRTGAERSARSSLRPKPSASRSRFRAGCGAGTPAPAPDRSVVL
jgi:pyruvate/2-oxoglutarate/acetoin dehydrogenase E1 component